MVSTPTSVLCTEPVTVTWQMSVFPAGEAFSNDQIGASPCLNFNGQGA